MKLKLSSDRLFYSIQGEGPSIGVPAYFLRLAHCTLDCVWCDTAEVWKNSTTFTYEQVRQLFEEFGAFDRLSKGAHLILTGGSPLLQQSALAGFLGYLMFSAKKEKFDWTIECETEGVLMPEELVPFVAQWNVSPKLSSSGMDPMRRYKSDVLHWHNVNSNSYFKFPVSDHQDLREVLTIVEACSIFPQKVFLMPVADTKAKLEERSLQVVDWCKQYGFSFSTRLHLSLWDKKTGV